MDPLTRNLGFVMGLKDPDVQCQGGGDAGRAFEVEFSLWTDGRETDTQVKA